MPRKNVVKTFVSGGYYHVYNRGNNKARVFTNEKDYRVFLSYLRTYLLPKDTEALFAIINDPNSSPIRRDQAVRELNLNNYHDCIELLAYCLMSNHFHLLLKQSGDQDMHFLMKSLLTRYVIYFNKNHSQSGRLFEGTYKAVLIESDEQLLYLTRYIHLNPLGLRKRIPDKLSLQRCLISQPSSYPNYLRTVQQAWLKPDFILKNFTKTGFNSYQEFIESVDADLERGSQYILKGLTLEG